MVRAASRLEDRGGRTLVLKTGAPDDRDGHQPAAPAHDRSMTVRNFVEKTRNDYIRHVKNLTAFLGRSPDTATAEKLRLYQLHLTEGGGRPPADHQRCGFGPAVLLLRHGGPARCHQTADVRRRAAQDPRRVKPRGGGVGLGGGAWAEVQGCPERRLWRGPARVRGRSAQGRRRRFQAHAAQDRAGQGATGSLCDALAAAARTLA